MSIEEEKKKSRKIDLDKKEKKKFIDLSFVKNIFKKKKEEDIDVNVVEGSVSSDTFEKKELSEADIKAQDAAKKELADKKKRFKKLIRRIVIIVIGIILLIMIIIFVSKIKKKSAEKKELMKSTKTVLRMNISSELSGSGTLAAKDSYTITSLVEGNVIKADFEVGDIVKKDQLLYEIESGTAYRTIANASSSLAQAKDNYEKASTDYTKNSSDFKDGIYHSQFTGTIKTLNIKKGDIISGNTDIGTIVNDRIMSIKVPFMAFDANTLAVGMDAVAMLSDTDECILGKITNIDKEPQTYKSGAQVKYVKVECPNPGGLSTDDYAKVYAGLTTSISEGNFEVGSEDKITLGEGNNVEVEYLIAKEGQYVYKGSPLFKITNQTILNVTSSKKNSFLSAEASLQRAENTLEDAWDSYDEYYIKAPIDGTIITKDVKVGDKLQRNASSTKTLATIFDLSELKFDMQVDELDIGKVKVGQEVEIEADAFAGKRFKGFITNVSLVSQSSNGVSNYPVTVTLYETGDLLPGMNVDGYVILEKADNCLSVPSDALQRGSVVYLTNESPTVKNKTYNIENISDRIKNNTPTGFTAVKVTTGVSNENFIEIKEGLQEGDVVYVPETSSTSGFNMRGGMPGGMGGGPMGGGGMGGGMRR